MGSSAFARILFWFVYGNGVLTANGPFWQHSRALVRPAFTQNHISDLSSFDIHIQRFFNLLPKDGSEVDLSPLFNRLAPDSSAECIFGESVAYLLPNASLDAAAFLEAYKYGQIGIGRRMQTLQLNILTWDRRFRDSCRYHVNLSASTLYVDGAISYRFRLKPQGGKKERYVVAHRIAKENEDRKDILSRLMNIFLPAHDVNGVGLTNVFFCLARRPDVYIILRDKVLATCGANGSISHDDLKNFTYLRCVLNEAVKLHPSIGQMNRVALGDTILPIGGSRTGDAQIFAFKGTVMATSFYSLHRRRELYGEDADQFRPER